MYSRKLYYENFTPFFYLFFKIKYLCDAKIFFLVCLFVFRFNQIIQSKFYDQIFSDSESNSEKGSNSQKRSYSEKGSNIVKWSNRKKGSEDKNICFHSKTVLLVYYKITIINSQHENWFLTLVLKIHNIQNKSTKHIY